MMNSTTPSRKASDTARILCAAILGLVVSLAAHPEAIAGVQSVKEKPAQWIAQPPLLQARAGLGVATAGGRIYAVGGRAVDDTQYNNVESRKLTGGGTWTSLPPLPSARGNLSVSASGGKVYAIGGFRDPYTSTGRPTNDPITRQWAIARPLPQPRAIAGAASLNGILYVAGGYVELPDGSLQISDTVLAYDPGSDQWRPAAPMTSPREGLRLVAAGPYLYAIGGGGIDGDSLATVERYDPATDTWTATAPMNESRWLPCAVETKVGNTHLIAVVAGGEFLPGGELVDGRRTTEVLDLDTGHWTLLDALLPFVRASQDCAVTPNGNILAIGGATHDSGTFTYLANVDELALKPRDLR